MLVLKPGADRALVCEREPGARSGSVEFAATSETVGARTRHGWSSSLVGDSEHEMGWHLPAALDWLHVPFPRDPDLQHRKETEQTCRTQLLLGWPLYHRQAIRKRLLANSRWVKT